MIDIITIVGIIWNWRLEGREIKMNFFCQLTFSARVPIRLTPVSNFGLVILRISMLTGPCHVLLGEESATNTTLCSW